ncbi:MAG TPA: nickel pincer cofactor biosynthesis protein LarC [Acidobacteriota bacterium]|jgi:hypothetical protein
MILIFDPFSGISGDMTVGALLDAGLPFKRLERAFEEMKLEELSLASEPTVRAGIGGTKFRVTAADQKSHRHLSQILKIIDSNNSLGARAREFAHAIFRRLAEAEADVHRTTVEKVHFHEVGAVDSIVDILGAAIGFEYFGVEEFFSGAINVGHGTIQCDHGILPVPPPATALLLKGFDTFPGTVPSEMTTPTGAAIIAALAKPLPAGLPVRQNSVGYGAGDRDFAETPNLLRIFLGERAGHLPGAGDVVEIQSNIDDMNPQLFVPLVEKLLSAGALDAFYQPVTMKRGRPGILLTVLCESSHKQAVCDILFRETTTLGVRYQVKQRDVLNRVFLSVNTEYGQVRIKVARSGADVLNYAPEFEDCRKLAEAGGVPLKEVYNAAMAAYWEARKEKGQG